MKQESFVAPKGRKTLPLREIVLPHQCPLPVRLGVLGRASYFAGLEAGELEQVDARMSTFVYDAGETVHRAGEPATELCVVAEGRVKLSQISANGTETVTDILVPGELFGAMGSLGQPRHLQSAHALVPSCILKVGQGDFRQILEEHPAVALRVLDDVAGRLGQAHAEIGGQHTQTVKERVATALLRLADKLGERNEKGVLLEVPLSRADLAGLARTTPESASRVMSEWKKLGVIQSGRRWTALVDTEFLVAEAGLARDGASAPSSAAK